MVAAAAEVDHRAADAEDLAIEAEVVSVGAVHLAGDQVGSAGAVEEEERHEAVGEVGADAPCVASFVRRFMEKGQGLPCRYLCGQNMGALEFNFGKEKSRSRMVHCSHDRGQAGADTNANYRTIHQGPMSVLAVVMQ